MSSSKTSKLKYIEQKTKLPVPHRIFRKTQTVQGKAILKQECNSGKNSAP